MKGLELAEAYYKSCEEQIRELLGNDLEAVSVGLCGQGSECFGFDDEISRDHDFGPGFCIFMDDMIYEKHGKRLEQFYEALPKKFLGMERIVSSHGQGRVGVIRTKDFYFGNLGTDHAPENLFQWYQLSEERLAMVTNGRIFHAGNDAFMALRKTLQEFYPKEVFYKKLASRLAVMAQAGQYNYARCLERKDDFAAYLALGIFLKNAVSALYLLKGSYMPFYKWAYKGLEQLEGLTMMRQILSGLAKSRCGVSLVRIHETESREYDTKDLIAAVCGEVVKECLRQELLPEPVSYLEDGAVFLQERITDDLLRRLPLEM